MITGAAGDNKYHYLWPLVKKKLENVKMKSQKHGCLIGSSAPNVPIKAPEARFPFSVFLCIKALFGREGSKAVWFAWRKGGGVKVDLPVI